MKKLIWQRKDWPSFYWTNSEALEGKINDLHDLRSAYSLQVSGLAAAVPNLEKNDPFSILNAIESARNERFANLKSEIDHIKKWWAQMPEELDPFIRAGVIAFWCEILFYNDPNVTYISGFFAKSCFLKRSESEFLIHTLLSEIKSKKSAYLLTVAETAQKNGDLTNWLSFYFDLLTAFLSENVEGNGAIAFREDFNSVYNAKLNLRQKKFLVHMSDSLTMDFKMTNLYYSAFCRCSRETAKRDLAVLVQKGFLAIYGQKRGVWYQRRLN